MELKSYQQATLDALQRYLSALNTARENAARVAALGLSGVHYEWDAEAWGLIGRDKTGYQQRRSGAGRSIPTICFKIPTGGGKTLLGVKAIETIQTAYLRRHTGLVLWIVPTSEIYRQTYSAFRDRSHPYRQLLDLASGGRTRIIQKDDPFTPADVANNLIVLLIMLPAASRENKETLRMFRERGGMEAFFPTEEDYDGHRKLLQEAPNLDTFSNDGFGASKIIKGSLGNALRLLSPLIVLDEGHKAYSDIAQQTLLGFNPAFILELSATPTNRSNKLVEISGRDVHREGMIKLDLHLSIKSSGDWRDTMLAAHEQRVALESEAQVYAMRENGAYIRPICLIQAERTGAKQRKVEFIHAEDVREFLITRCNILPEWIAVKSSEQDDLGDSDLLSSTCQIRYIITRYALQEGWDCPFAYVLAVLPNAEAATSLTQLVGRVLRQPYARKTGIATLDESYVYASQVGAGRALDAVRRGLQEEGLGELTGRIVLDSTTTTSSVEVPIRAQYRGYVGKIYLPCFVVGDGSGGYREVRYERDVLSRVPWDQIDLSAFHPILNPSARQDSTTIVGINTTMAGSLQTNPSQEQSVDLVFITRHLLDVVPNPWRAYAFAHTAIENLRTTPGNDEAMIARNQSFVIEELKKKIVEERNRLAQQTFIDMLDSREMNFYLIAGAIGTTETVIPDRISMRSDVKRLTRADHAPTQLELFEYSDESEYNESEREVALYLDAQAWAIEWWHRNLVRHGYSLQGWKPNRVWPDFLAYRAKSGTQDRIYVLETKGLHLKGNDDTAYKQALFKLCNERSQPTPIEAINQNFAAHHVRFEVIFEDEWQNILNTLLAPAP